MPPPDLLPFAGPEHQPFDLGAGSRGALLVHGFPGTPADVRPVGEELAKNGWRVCGPLLPGFGRDIANLNRTGRADWLHAIEEAWADLRASCGPCALLGYSMGGALALNLADRLRPDGLTLIAPFWHAPGFLPKLVPLARLVAPTMRPFEKADFDDPSVRAQFERVTPGIDLDDPEVRDFIRSEFTLPLGAIHEVLRLGRDAFRRARSVTVPTLVIQGLDDETIRPADTRRLVKRMRRAPVTYHEVAGGHHLAHAHSPHRAAVAGLIVDYLATI